jgi:hypothetical protein
MPTRLIDVDDFPLGLIDIELSTPPTELVGDTAAFLLRSEQGPPAAVLKVARGLLGAAELRTQRRVLAELAIHPRLDEEWRGLLPRILAFDERTDATPLAAAAPIAHADATDDAFGAALAAKGMHFGSPNKAFIAGHEVCDELGNGKSAAQVASTVQSNSNMDGYHSGFFVGASIRAYCPQYAS